MHPRIIRVLPQVWIVLLPIFCQDEYFYPFHYAVSDKTNPNVRQNPTPRMDKNTQLRNSG